MTTRKIRSFKESDLIRYWTKVSPEKLFDMQLQILASRTPFFFSDTPSGVTSETFKPLKILAEKAIRIVGIKKGNIPFIIANRRMPVDVQVEYIKERRSYPSVDFGLDIDKIGTPSYPESNSDWYLLVDVDIGRETEGMTSSEALIHLENEWRKPLDLSEGIGVFLCMTEEIYHRAMLLPGSVYGKDGVPYLSFLKDKETGMGCLRIAACRPNTRYPKWGVASCQSRIGVDDVSNDTE